MNEEEISSTRNILLDLAERLRRQAATVTQPNVQNNRQQSSSQAAQPPPAVVQPGSSQHRPSSMQQPNAVAEHRRLFGYSAKGKEKQNKKGKAINKRAKPTCSLKFVCLANRETEKPPTSVRDRTALANAGLGDATISFLLDGDSLHFHGEMLQKFPRLASTGYELMLYDRAGDNSSFCKLKPPYLPRKLKEVVGQCKIYVKPLQDDLVIQDSEVLGKDDEQVDNGPMVSCTLCNAEVSMTMITSHHESVHGSEPKAKRRREEPCIIELLQRNSSGPSTSQEDQTAQSHEVRNTLHALVPTASDNDINLALDHAHGDVDEAAQQLLGLTDDEDEILILNTTMYTGPTKGGCSDQSASRTEDSTHQTIEQYRQKTVDDSAPRQKFTVSREEGHEELKRDIMGCYKNPQVNLKANLKVKFEGEEGVGSGPIREFLLCAMKIVEEGIDNGKKALIFEGEDDHKLPVHDHILGCTGAFKAVGRIIGHSMLHQGPLVYGLSSAVLEYWRLTACDNGEIDTFLENLPLCLQDIPDMDLRDYIIQLDNLPIGEDVPADLRESLTPYILEAGLDPDMLHQSRKIISQGLVLYNIVLKRRRELDEIAKGMNEVNLHTFIGKCTPEELKALFPDVKKKCITAEQIKEVIQFEESSGHEDTIIYFFEYICQLEKYEAGKPSLTDLCCFWTATNSLPPRASLLVKFHEGQEVLPFAETCFSTITLPTVHPTYGDFQRFMDTALNHGSMGIHHT